ncbi:MAG: FliH/SctL family protein [Betaproteobacteria bacterium]
MSDALRKDRTPERTARVWQSADFQNADQVGAGFQPSAWQVGKAAQFSLPSQSSPEQEQEALLELAQEEQATPDAAMALPAPAAALVLPTGQFSQEDLEQARLQAYEQGKQHGLREAQDQSRNEAGRWQQEAGARMQALERGVWELMQSSERMYEPLKRLALHLAEQLVIGELAVSAQSIERLVRRCVEELDAQRGVPVLVELHPDDLAAMQALMKSLTPEGVEASDSAKLDPAWVLQGNASLMPGSVRASANDAVVSDLIEHRLESLARQLLVSPVRAGDQSALRSDRVAARRADVTQVLDAQPRMAPTPRSSRFGPVIDAQATTVDVPGTDVSLSGPLPDDLEPESAP